jgi:REP element-mobilizing transposase RayT
MILAYHCVITAYGFWLPNDPRGSWSDWVRQWELLAYGKATKVSTQQSVAKQPHDGAERRAAKRALRYPPVHFTGQQALAVGMGFKRAIAESGYIVHACSILPQHVHLVVARCARRAEQIIAHLKARATQRLAADGLHPLDRFRETDGTVPSPWARKGWPVFLESDQRILGAIDYVEKNPLREGKRPQRWSFVVPFMPSGGHSGV